MTQKQLEIASHRVLKMLRKRPMPYKCTQLQADTSYAIEERLEILHYLRHNHYIKDISFVDIILTEKGKNTGSYYATRLNKWYGALPTAARYLLSPASAALVTGFCLFLYLEASRDNYRPYWKSAYQYHGIDSIQTAYDQKNKSENTPLWKTRQQSQKK